MRRRAGFTLALCFFAAQMLPASVAEIDERVLCIGCHESIEEDRAAQVQHPPLHDGECSICHNPHVSRYPHLLRARESRLCEGCHTNLIAERQQEFVHSPAAEGRCVRCHQPHGSENSNLLVHSIGTDLCGGCHESVSTWFDRNVRHRPFDRGDCMTCHTPHASVRRGLLNAPVARICGSCHADERELAALHFGAPVVGADCVSCHDPHASGRKNLVRKIVHPMIHEGSCFTCHQPDDPGQTFSVPQESQQLCGGCHAEQLANPPGEKAQHVSEFMGGCVACHEAHTADEPGLLKNEACIQCHADQGSSSDHRGQHISHGNDLGCVECHEVHGGDSARYLIDDVVGLCSGCHNEVHRFSHPMGDEARDPRDGLPIDCLTCHGIHSAEHDHLIHRSAERDLCLTCHREIGRGLQ